MNKLLLLLLTLGYSLMAQEKQVLLEESRSYYSGAEFVYKLNDNFVTAKDLNWRLVLAEKTLAQGQLKPQDKNFIKWQLPKVKEGSFVTGNLELISASNQMSQTIPFYLLGDKQISFKHDKVFILSDGPEIENEATLSAHGLFYELVQNHEAVSSQFLILKDVQLYDDLNVFLKSFVSKGGKVLVLGYCAGEFDFGQWNLDKIELLSKKSLNTEIKGFNTTAVSTKESWELDFQHKLINLVESNLDTASYSIRLRSGKGEIVFFSADLFKHLDKDPSLMLYLQKMIQSKNK
ncbi:hypothetical protein LNTAR_18480 [Lentisphaera araneosa HTCC2155]|uniref:Uncharacterized protein n=1 Tax=Lentisphaera araneosa HTCC2155 TaxID=313628 RepID=A6DNK2_9BACT|nr:hypothetical protein [Lentisphaera araneosa]EDM26661.1 hypothetical protein LNTAR_18480 [Lentisphaera araneosa HTCC2155]